MNQEPKVLTFVNWTSKQFNYPWDGKVYSFAPGQSNTFEAGIARHFAKHLAKQEINKLGPKLAPLASTRQNEDGTFPEGSVFADYFNKGILAVEPDETGAFSPEALEIKSDVQSKPATTPKTKLKAQKDAPPETEPEAEDEFAEK